MRLIALDRPGFGSSTFQPGRRILDWAADVDEAADLLGLDRFAVLGVSGGGPYALACGHELKERVTRIGVAVGIAPPEAPGMDKAAIAQTSKRYLVRRVQFGLAAYAMRAGREDRLVDVAIRTMASGDRDLLATGRVREIFTETMKDALTQGGRGAAYEAGLYLKPIGFDLAKIRVPTSLWYSEDDDTVPATAGRWLADQIPGSQFEGWPATAISHGCEVKKQPTFSRHLPLQRDRRKPGRLPHQPSTMTAHTWQHNRATYEDR